MSAGSRPASARAPRPASTTRSRRDLPCWILWGVLPIPSTPTRMRLLLVRFGLAAAGPTVVRRQVDRLARDLAGGADGGRRGRDLDVLGDRLAGAVGERQQVVAGPGAVEAERQGQPHRGRPQVADLGHEAGAPELLGAH